MEVITVEKSIFLKFDEIRSKLRSNFSNYDLNQINELLVSFEQQLKLCIKINDDLLSFFREKSNLELLLI